MGFARIKQQDHNNTYYTEFVVDTIADLQNLPSNFNAVAVGSAAICLENSEVYMLNSEGEWVML
jgi:hypothetical protein